MFMNRKRSIYAAVSVKLKQLGIKGPVVVSALPPDALRVPWRLSGAYDSTNWPGFLQTVTNI